MALPLLLAGPIVRRATPEEVWFWFASSQEVVSCTPKVTAYDAQGRPDGRLNRGDGSYPLEQAELRVARLGRSLWVALVSARPSTPFAPGRMYGYDLAVTTKSGTSTVSSMRLGINYQPFGLPTFLLASGARRIAHGSCRRPGATGEDAFAIFDQWLTARAGNPAERPSSLILTGDQIYADDVAFPLFKAVQRLAVDVCGYVERLPRDGEPPVLVTDYKPYKQPPLPSLLENIRFPPPEMTRKGLTWRGFSPIGFTTEDGEAHLLSFPEFAAMYLVTWNPELCRAYGVDDGTEENLRFFTAAVAAARRVLANMATYMVFDDHEITDDWNLDADWEKATKNAMGHRIIANGLAAYWAFQGWGNDPNQFGAEFTGAITRHIEGSLIQGPGTAPATAPAAKAFDEALLKRHWSFVAPTNPPALCVDTRTRRETRDRHTILSGRYVWPFLTELRIRHQLKRGAPLLIVLPTPFLQHRSSLWAQHTYDWPEQRYEGDYEWYGDYPAQRPELIAFLRRDFDPPALVVFSGDVHHGSVIDGLYVHGPSRDAIYNGKGTWAMRVVQVTSSPIKNIKRDVYLEGKWWLGGTDLGNAGESLISQFENQYATQPDGTVLAMRADAMTLSGALGRSTFVPENHLCVVDLPAVAGDDVKALFIGLKDGALATAQTSVSTRNDPSKFMPPLAWMAPILTRRHEAELETADFEWAAYADTEKPEWEGEDEGIESPEVWRGGAGAPLAVLPELEAPTSPVQRVSEGPMTKDYADQLLWVLDDVVNFGTSRLIGDLSDRARPAFEKLFAGLVGHDVHGRKLGGRERRESFDEAVLALRDVLAFATDEQRAALRRKRDGLLRGEASDRVDNSVIVGKRILEIPGDGHPREQALVLHERLPTIVHSLQVANEYLHRLAEGGHEHYEAVIKTLEEQIEKGPHYHEIEELLDAIEKDAQPGKRTVERLGVLIAFLGTVDGWLTLSDEELRDHLTEIHGVWANVSSFTELVKAVTEIGMATVSLTAGLASGIAKLAGDEVLAAEAMTVAGQVGGLLGDVVAGIEILHGIFVLLDSHATRAQKEDAVAGIASASAWLIGRYVIGEAAVGGPASLAITASYLMFKVSMQLYWQGALGVNALLMRETFEYLRDTGRNLARVSGRVERAGMLLQAETDPIKANPLRQEHAESEEMLATMLDDFLAHCTPGGAKDMGWGGTFATAPGNVQMLAEAFAPLLGYRTVKSGSDLLTGTDSVVQRIAWCLVHAREIEIASTQHKHLSDIPGAPAP